MKNYNFIFIFDLDGTIVHSVPDMHDAMNKTLNKYNLKNISEQKLQDFVGEGMLSLSKKVVDFCGGDKSLYEKIFQNYRKNYADQPFKYSSLMPGVLDTLNYLDKKNIPMGICTNKRQAVAEKLIHQMKLKKYFKVIVGARNNIPLKPKPDMLLLAMDKFNVFQNNFIFVGDTLVDIKTAKYAGITSIIIEGGYVNSNTNLDEANFKFKQIDEIITRFFECSNII